jgi:hypothetical protein
MEQYSTDIQRKKDSSLLEDDKPRCKHKVCLMLNVLVPCYMNINNPKRGQRPPDISVSFVSYCTPMYMHDQLQCLIILIIFVKNTFNTKDLNTGERVRQFFLGSHNFVYIYTVYCYVNDSYCGERISAI